jgi:hypothetical protein
VLAWGLWVGRSLAGRPSLAHLRRRGRLRNPQHPLYFVTHQQKGESKGAQERAPQGLPHNILNCAALAGARQPRMPSPSRRPPPEQGDARTLSFVPDLAVAAALRACSPSALRHLDLSGCLEVTDAGLAPVAALAALRELVLHNCMKIAAGAVEVRGRCTEAVRGDSGWWLDTVSTAAARGPSRLVSHSVQVTSMCRYMPGFLRGRGSCCHDRADPCPLPACPLSRPSPGCPRSAP